MFRGQVSSCATYVTQRELLAKHQELLIGRPKQRDYSFSFAEVEEYVVSRTVIRPFPLHRRFFSKHEQSAMIVDLQIKEDQT